MHPHVEEWDRYWKDKSIKKRMIEYVRRNYFSKIFIFEILKNVQTGGSLLEAGCGSGTYFIRRLSG